MAQYKVDPFHTTVGFVATHMMITKVRGKFDEVDAVVNYNPDQPENSSVEATVNVASINTNAKDRDNHLRSGDFFDVETYPTITFKSKRVEMSGDNSAKLIGDLTIKGVTREVELDTQFVGQSKNPMTGDTTIGFTASTKLNREDFGLTWNVALETGGWLVGREIEINLEVQCALLAEAAQA
jgi:polyisoprenoid-binding protein YceI